MAGQLRQAGRMWLELFVLPEETAALGSAADTSVRLVRRQQGERAVLGVGVVFECPLGSAQPPYLPDICDEAA